MKKKHFLIFIIIVLFLSVIFYSICVDYQVKNIVLVDIVEKDNGVILKLDSSNSGSGFVSCDVKEDSGIYTLYVKTSLIGSKTWPQEINIDAKLNSIKAIEVMNPNTKESRVIYPK